MNRLFITVEEPDVVIAGGFTVIRVYTDTAESGAFTALDGTVTLVAGTESYEYTDANGTSATWYKTAYFGTVPGESDKSAARRGETSAAYGTVKELRNLTQKTGITTDVELALLLDAATQAIDRYCNLPDGFAAPPTPTARIYAGSGGTVQWIDPCISVITVAVKDSPSDDTYTAWAAGDWIAASGDPEVPDFNRLPYKFLIVTATGTYQTFTSGSYTGLRGFRRERSDRRGVPTVQVTSRWGESAAPPPVIKTACLAQASRWYKRFQSSFADNAGSIQLGALSFRLRQEKLDPDVRHMLSDGRFVRPAIGRRF